MNRRPRVLNVLVVIVKTLLISWTLMFLAVLAEEFGWHLFREAGGGVAGVVRNVSAASTRPSSTTSCDLRPSDHPRDVGHSSE